MLPFYFKIQPGKPIYEQLSYAVRRAITSGALRAGDKFPSVRELSKEISINPNTAQKAVSELVSEGFLQVHPGVGTIVAERNRAATKIELTRLHEQIEELAVAAQSLGIEREEFIKLVEKMWRKK